MEMDVQLVTPEAAAKDRSCWMSLADRYPPEWLGLSAEKIERENGAGAINLPDALGGQLMQDLGITARGIELLDGEDRRMIDCTAVRLTFGQSIDLGPHWVAQGLGGLLKTAMMSGVGALMSGLEEHVVGVEVPGQTGQVADGATKTGAFAMAMLSDSTDGRCPIVHVIIPCITHTPQGKWLYLDPGFWLVNRRMIAGLFDDAMVDAYPRVTEYFGLGQLPGSGPWL
jgi:hypothetical protein